MHHRLTCILLLRTADQDHPCIPSVTDTSEDPTYANGSPPPLLSSAVRSSSRFPPASLPGNPEVQPSQAIVRPHILTHLIEGFVIREGLEPFPVCPLVDNVAIHSRHEALITPMVNASLLKPSGSKISPSLRAQCDTVRLGEALRPHALTHSQVHFGICRKVFHTSKPQKQLVGPVLMCSFFL